MADSSKLAAGVVVAAVLVALGAAWLFGGGSSDEPEPVIASDGERPQGVPESIPGIAAPGTPQAAASRPAPGSVEGRIADLEASYREQQAEHLAEASRLGQEVQAGRERMAEIERAVLQIEEGKLTRLSAREDKSEGKCDPSEPDSRACKRQVALQERVGEVEASRAALESELVELQALEEQLLAWRAEQLRGVDSVEEKLHSDPELVSLYTQLAEGG